MKLKKNEKYINLLHNNQIKIVNVNESPKENKKKHPFTGDESMI